MAKAQTPKLRPKRAEAPSCGTCRYFNEGNGGECRRYPPYAITRLADHPGPKMEWPDRLADRFPGVRPDDIWCGEYEP